jgi:predicted acetyltransferase
MELVLPSIQYKDSFLRSVAEYKETDTTNPRVDDLVGMKVEEVKNNFEDYVAKKISQSRGENLPEGYVPCTHLWLVDNGEFVGRVDIRHRLTPHLLHEGGHIGYDIRPSKRGRGHGKTLLKLALAEAQKLGINKVLVMCHEGNIGSQKVIEANGGVLENTVTGADGKTILRFWINK